MRKLTLLLLTLSLAFGGFAQAYDAPSYDSYNELRNAGGRSSVPVRVVKLVRYSNFNEDGPDVAVGDALIWDTNSDDGVSVAYSTNSRDGSFAGIAATAIKTADLSTTTAAGHDGARNWGYIVVSGYASAKVAAGAATSFAAGDRFVTSGDDGAIGTCQTMANGTTALGTNVNEAAQCHSAVGGIVLDAGAVADTSIEVMVETL